jgi:hypothetical protein
MSRLKTVRNEPEKRPIKLGLMGQPGVGKTTFLAGIPNHIIIPIEPGAELLKCTRILWPSTSTLNDVLETLRELAAEKHNYDALCIDGLSALEQLIFRSVVADAKKPGVITSIEDFGYGKGYVIAVEKWRQVLQALDVLHEERGMHIILTGHIVMRPVNDPTQSEPYDAWQPALLGIKQVGTLLVGWLDAMAYAVHEDLLQPGKRKAIGTGLRKLRCHHHPAMAAKNRWGITEDIDLSWPALIDAIRDDIVEAREEAMELASKIKDEERKQKAIKWIDAQRSALAIRSQMEQLRAAGA